MAKTWYWSCFVSDVAEQPINNRQTEAEVSIKGDGEEEEEEEEEGEGEEEEEEEHQEHQEEEPPKTTEAGDVTDAEDAALQEQDEGKLNQTLFHIIIIIIYYHY